MKRFFQILLALFVGLILFIIMMFVPSTNQWNQKLTMYIDTPQGEVVAFSVVNIKYGSALKIWGAMDGADFDMTGEATVADLGNGRFVFALLTETGEGLAKAAYHDVYDAREGSDHIARRTNWIRKLTKQTEEREIPVEAYPLLVSFGDITEPTSVREVKADDFAASFGEGYALKRMTLQVTDGVTSKGAVVNVLSWLPDRVENLRPTKARLAQDVLEIEKIGTPSFIRISK